MSGLFRKKHLTRITPSEAIDEIIGKYIASRLKSEGFKKVGRTWIRDCADCSFVINVQASKWNSKDDGASFVVNYGIYVPSIYELLFGMRIPKSPREYDCVLRKRLSDNKKSEIWWEIYDYTDTMELGRKLVDEISKQCLELFNKIGSLSDVVNILKEDGSTPLSLLTCALLYIQLDDIDKAKDFFISAYHRSSENEQFQSKVLRVAKSFGFSL